MRFSFRVDDIEHSIRAGCKNAWHGPRVSVAPDVEPQDHGYVKNMSSMYPFLKTILIPFCVRCPRHGNRGHTALQSKSKEEGFVFEPYPI